MQQEMSVYVLFKKSMALLPFSSVMVGLEVASGDWIDFVDSDDYIESDYYEYLYSIAARTGAEIVQCGAFFEFGHMSK